MKTRVKKHSRFLKTRINKHRQAILNYNEWIRQSRRKGWKALHQKQMTSAHSAFEEEAQMRALEKWHKKRLRLLQRVRRTIVKVKK